MAGGGVSSDYDPFDVTQYTEDEMRAGVRCIDHVQLADEDTAYALAKKHGIKLAWGTDTLFDPVLATRQGKQLARMQRWFTPAQTLRMATHDNAELLALSGPRSPNPGRLGVVDASHAGTRVRAMGQIRAIEEQHVQVHDASST
jgi:cytosine/adenosine deaminase-related metal-dependent hydrolase